MKTKRAARRHLLKSNLPVELDELHEALRNRPLAEGALLYISLLCALWELGPASQWDAEMLATQSGGWSAIPVEDLDFTIEKDRIVVGCKVLEKTADFLLCDVDELPTVVFTLSRGSRCLG